MITLDITLTTSYQNLSTILKNAGFGANPPNPQAMENGFFRNTDTTINMYIASGYNTAPTTNIGLLGATQGLLFNDDFNANLCWVKAASGSPILQFVVGSNGFI